MMSLYKKLFRPWPPVRTLAALSDFIDENAAFLAQKGIYEFARARAGHYAKVLFRELEFQQAVERSRWQAYPLGLAMVAEVAEGVLSQHDAYERPAMHPTLSALVLDVFDRYPTPDPIGLSQWTVARQELHRQLHHISLHPRKFAKDIPEPFARSYFACMPIHPKLRASDFPTITNYLRATLCNIHDELSQRVDAAAIIEQLRSGNRSGQIA
jgi:hypothetical protein